jgi:tRNA nucleotidyltransferase (CCA-adding enzyme)
LKIRPELIEKLIWEGNYCINLSNPDRLSPSIICRELSGLSMEFLFYIMSEIKNKIARRRIINYLTRWRHVKSTVSGSDLIEMNYQPGPYFRQAINEVKEKVMDGIIKGREDALEHARNFMETIGAPKKQ